MKIYNTLTNQIEEFVALEDKKVRMYVCGITPYDEVHLGHGRCYVVFDLIRRFLTYKGYDVKYVQNFTDIDDKIISAAQQQKISPKELSSRYITSYFEVEKELNITPANFYPKVTEHIDDIISAVEKLVQKGFAYVTATGVYFDISKFTSYGKLSKRKLEELIVGARVEPDETKKHPLDFALWKFTKEQESEIFDGWNSPWGKGRPGWHIECSVMSMKYLGETIDIHGGGADLIFPHHENEIAQSEALTGKNFVNYWVHNGFVTINKQKMSKSLKNIFTLKDLFKLYSPMVIKLFLLSQHYQNPLDYSVEEIEQFKSVYQKFLNLMEEVDFKLKNLKLESAVSQIVRNEVESMIKNFESALEHNLNTSEALSVINNMYSFIFNLQTENKNDILYSYENFLKMLDILGIKFNIQKYIPQEILLLVQQRELARKNKDFAKADDIRNEVFQKGYIIEDTKYGPKIKRKQ